MGGLPNVGAAQDREPVGFRIGRRLFGWLRQLLDDPIQEIADPQPMLGRGQVWFVETELQDLVSEMAIVRRIWFVRCDEDSPAGTANQPHDLSGDRRQAVVYVEDQHADLGLI